MDEETQRKYFEKFRKRHMLPKDRGLNNGVDVIRNVGSEAEPKDRTVSVISTAGDHTYEDIVSFNKVKTQGTDDTREYSFFDESFETVVEASTSSAASSQNSFHDNQVQMQHLGIPSAKASYLSLRPDSSRSDLFTASSVQLSGVPDQGEINSAFSEASLANINNRLHDDTYLVPRNFPAIKIIQPSFRKPDPPSKMRESKATTNSKPPPNIFHFDESHCLNMNDLSEKKIQNDEIRFKNLRKILMEGPTSHTETRSRLSYDSSLTHYEEMKESRIENNTYKSLTSLVLPSRRSYIPKNTTRSTQSDHTYESITAELSSEMMRGDMNGFNDMASVLPDPSKDLGENHCFQTPCRDGRRKSVTFEGLNDLNKSSEHTYESSPDHTYESLRGGSSSHGTTGLGTPDMSVVIIGKRRNGLYDSIRSSNSREKRQPLSHQVNVGLNPEFKKPWSDSTDRYSPFPSSKKLAIKSSFRPLASPKCLNTETVTDRLTPFRIPEGLGNLGQSCRRFSIENREPHTPEIFVDDTSTVFFSPKKQFFRPLTLAVPDERGQSGVSPLCTYQTLKACSNLKMRDLSGRKSDKRNSLPSVSDQLEAEIRSHCDLNEFQSSTPFC